MTRRERESGGERECRWNTKEGRGGVRRETVESGREEEVGIPKTRGRRQEIEELVGKDHTGAF